MTLLKSVFLVPALASGLWSGLKIAETKWAEIQWVDAPAASGVQVKAPKAELAKLAGTARSEPDETASTNKKTTKNAKKTLPSTNPAPFAPPAGKIAPDRAPDSAPDNEGPDLERFEAFSGDPQLKPLEDDLFDDLEGAADPIGTKISKEDVIIQRRIRIERILLTLDHVAEAALQMNPENAERVEPVIIDLAEQTLELVPEDAVAKASTDTELEKIEETVDELVVTLSRMVEPEMSL